MYLQMHAGDCPAAFFRDLFSGCRVLSAAAAAAMPRQTDSRATSAADAAAADAVSQPKPAVESGTTAPAADGSLRQQDSVTGAAAGEQLVALGLSFEPVAGSGTDAKEEVPPQPEPRQQQAPVTNAPDADASPAAGQVIDVEPQPSGSNGSGASSVTEHGRTSSHAADGSRQPSGGHPAAAGAQDAASATLPPGVSGRRQCPWRGWLSHPAFWHCICTTKPSYMTANAANICLLIYDSSPWPYEQLSRSAHMICCVQSFPSSFPLSFVPLPFFPSSRRVAGAAVPVRAAHQLQGRARRVQLHDGRSGAAG